MSDRFYPLESDAVISVSDIKWRFIQHSTFTTEEMRSSIGDNLRINVNEQENWVTGGVECKVLRPNGQGWQKGKVRIHIEFYPNEVPQEHQQLNGLTSNQKFPLDEVRQTFVED